MLKKAGKLLGTKAPGVIYCKFIVVLKLQAIFDSPADHQWDLPKGAATELYLVLITAKLLKSFRVYPEFSLGMA